MSISGCSAAPLRSDRAGTGRASADSARLRSRLWWIVGGYAVVATLWILFSDRMLEWLVDDADERGWYGTAKGLGFVAVTAILLLVLIRGALRQVSMAYVALEANDEQLQRRSRLHTALIEINQTIVRSPDRDVFLTATCRALVEDGGFPAAWITWHAVDGGPDVRVAQWGDPPTRVRGERAIRGVDRVVSPFAFPLEVSGLSCGELHVSTPQGAMLEAEEVALLAEAAADVSHALDNVVREAERAVALQSARQEQQFSETMIESMPGVVYFYDDAGTFLRWNSNFETVSGYSGEEIATMHPMDFFAPEARALVESRIAAVFETGEATVESPFVGKDGTAIPYIFTGRRVRFDGRACLVGVGVDITSRVRAEAAIQELNQTLERKVVDRTAELRTALVEAEAADRVKSAFLATMSHELRTPLNSIIGFTGILLQGLAGPLNDEQTKQLGMVQASARHLLALINDVLDISKIEAGQLDVVTQPFDIVDVIERVSDSLRPLAEQRGLGLHVRVDPGLGPMVGDRRRLEQILLNLLSNALKFTEVGHVEVRARLLDEPPGGAGASPPWVRLTVRDTGIGIEPRDLECLFQPFRQVDGGLSRQHQGTGLGLAISRRLAELMGGSVTASSEPSIGSEFAVVLPLLPAPTAAAPVLARGRA